MKTIGVDCVFAPDQTLRVRRIAVDGRWQSVEQGRQWVDGAGRHVLVMLADRQAWELVLGRETMNWSLQPAGGPGVTVV